MTLSVSLNLPCCVVGMGPFQLILRETKGSGEQK
jgi:hypothetical protein